MYCPGTADVLTGGINRFTIERYGMLSGKETPYPDNPVCKLCINRPCRRLFEGRIYPGKMIFVHHRDFQSWPCHTPNLIPTEEETEEAALTDDIEVITGKIEITNPRWESVPGTEGEKQSEEVSSSSEKVRLLVDVKNYPEGGPVVFDIYDCSEATPFRIDTVRGTNKAGTASVEWEVSDPQNRGSDLKLEFEASARSKYSPRSEIPGQSATETKEGVVTLSDVQFSTPAECLRPAETFDMQCTASTSAPTSSRQVTFHLFCRYTDVDGEQIEEEVSTGGFESSLPCSHTADTDYPLEAAGNLYLPSGSIVPGTELTYWLEARNTAAEAPVKGPEVQVIYRQVIRIVEVPDVLFHHNGYIPCLDEEGWLINALATALHYAEKEAPREYQDETQYKLKEEMVIFGHTDTSGEHSYNYDLSDFRARNVRNLLNQNVEDWKQIAAAHGKVEDHQRILKTLTTRYGWDCDPGKVDNIDGPVTRAAVKAFQQQAKARYNLTDLEDDGDIGPITWGAIHRVICGIAAQFMTVTDPKSKEYPTWQEPVYGYPEGEGCYGCGESFPIEEKNRDNYRSQTNRRVEILFMPAGKVPLVAPGDKNRALKKSECLPYDDDHVIRYSVQAGQLVVVVQHVDGTWYPDGTGYSIKRLGAEIASGQLDSGTTTPIFAFQESDYQIILPDPGLQTTIPGQPSWFEKQHVFID